MKKLLALMLSAALSLSLVACGGESVDKESTAVSTESSYEDIASCAEMCIRDSATVGPHKW